MFDYGLNKIFLFKHCLLNHSICIIRSSLFLIMAFVTLIVNNNHLNRHERVYEHTFPNVGPKLKKSIICMFAIEAIIDIGIFIAICFTKVPLLIAVFGLLVFIGLSHFYFFLTTHVPFTIVYKANTTILTIIKVLIYLVIGVYFIGVNIGLYKAGYAHPDVRSWILFGCCILLWLFLIVITVLLLIYYCFYR